jgi:hypothetical protein
LPVQPHSFLETLCDCYPALPYQLSPSTDGW